MVLVGVYVSPNSGLNAFQDFLDGVGERVRRYLPRQVLLLEDFDAHSSQWGNPRTDTRGRMLLGRSSATSTRSRYNRYALSVEFSEEHICDNHRDTSKARASGDIDRHLREEVVCSPEKSHWVLDCVTRNVSRAKRNLNCVTRDVSRTKQSQRTLTAKRLTTFVKHY
jgi:hypothetical protein